MGHVCQSPGLKEVILSVADYARATAFYRDVFGWHVVHEGTADPSVAHAWKLPADTPIRETLFREGHAATDLGQIRVVSIEGMEQVQIRSSAHPWEPGGNFDVDVNVRDLEAVWPLFQKWGFTGLEDPVVLDLGAVVNNEALAQGPDGVLMALIERVRPDFAIVDDYQSFSPIWNATQTVSDWDAAKAFYEDVLGFPITLDIILKWPVLGANMYGLPHNMADQIDVNVAICHPSGQPGSMGSVELHRMNGLEGRNWGDRAMPPNLGMMVLRFPVKDVVSQAEAMRAAGGVLEVEPMAVTLAPYGETTVCAIRTPDGCWFEFYEDLACVD